MVKLGSGVLIIFSQSDLRPVSLFSRFLATNMMKRLLLPMKMKSVNAERLADASSADIYDKFAEALATKVKAFKVGPGFDEGV